MKTVRKPIKADSKIDELVEEIAELRRFMLAQSKVLDAQGECIDAQNKAIDHLQKRMDRVEDRLARYTPNGPFNRIMTGLEQRKKPS